MASTVAGSPTELGNSRLIPARAVLQEIEAGLARPGGDKYGPVSSDHGFLPITDPKLGLPPSHRVWDEVAAALPALWRDCAVRSTVAGLPVLGASPDDIPDEYLWRASVVLGALAYSYVRCDIDDLHLPAPVAVPDGLLVPWRQVAQRMGRPQTYLAYDDLITHNWRLRNADSVDPLRLENLESLVPLLGSETERAFLIVNLEIQAQCAPLVEAAVRAQEAATLGDAEGVAEQLLVMLERVRHVTEVSFPKIDPNPYGAVYADPALWAKLVAPTGIPIVEGVPGISGAGASALQMVDAFLGRTQFQSLLGAEGKAVRGRYAPNVRRFLDAIEQVSVRKFVEQSQSRGLQGLFQALRDAYAGPHGYLGVHKRKVYGFIQVAFKVGRPSTASRISGHFRDRAWRQTTEQLEEARRERYWEGTTFAPYGVLEHREPASQQGAGVQRVTMGVEGAGVVFETGDRCGILAVNNVASVERTLQALRATGEERLHLPRSWRLAVVARLGGDVPEQLSLGEFLRYAKLRPLPREVAKALARFSASPELTAVVEERREDQLELWDAVEMMAGSGYDVTRLWKAELWQDEALAKIVPPETYRMYSLSSPPDASPLPDHLHLTVGPLRFRSRGASGEDVARHGTASTYLRQDAEIGEAIPVRVVRPLRFRLPADASRPVVMFAGGPGISPFDGFILDRLADPHSGPTWLFLGTRTRAEVCYADQLAEWAAAGRIQLRIAYSRDEVDGVPPGRIGQAMEEPSNAAVLWDFMQGIHHGGHEGYFYVCGQAGFAASVLSSLRAVAAAALGGHDADQAGKEMVRRLVGGGRFMQDIFTTFAPITAAGVAGAGLFDASEVVRHNDEEHGWWTVINGAVYDMTEFRHLHPGGYRIIDDNAGLDSTAEYRAVLHHDDSEIEAMLAMYKIGFIRRLDFGREWGIAITRQGIEYVSLHDAYRAWIRQLYLLVELENSLGNDFAVMGAPLTSAETDTTLTALKLQLVYDTQVRFLKELTHGVCGDDLSELWAVICGLVDPDLDGGRLGRQVGEVVAGGDGSRAAEACQRLRRLPEQLRGDETRGQERCAALVAALQAEDRRVLAEIKAALRNGLQVFEELQRDTLSAGGGRLIGSLSDLPQILAGFHGRLAATIEAFESGSAMAPTIRARH